MSKKLRIRMYNVGFGDSFLIEFPGMKTMLVDAGFHSQGKGAFGGNELAQQIAEDVEDVSGERRIDVIVATHRHQDHVFAFNSKVWDTVEVGEVWLPWVEDPANAEAASLWKKQSGFAAQFATALPGLALGADERSEIEFILWNAGAELASADLRGVMSAWSNKSALERLLSGFRKRDRARPRFLPTKKRFPETFECAAIPGLKVHVLGPARDPELIEELDPEKDGETYRALALLAAEATGPGFGVTQNSPFDAIWEVRNDELPLQSPILSQDERIRIADLARGVDALFAAEKLDGMINSTSLVLVLEYGKARLLMPGDAEWGTWKRILQNEEAVDLLRGATFAKLGHHGSHNATPKSLVEECFSTGMRAMISTQQGHGRYRNNIPLEELLDALLEKQVAYARSDTSAELPKGFERDEDDRWIDLRLRC